ncbi:hypothetical protein E4T44_00503 [Aureobasidium sp. EXF-8845]|nr:hypothetical protein E4T44_00503 [Aureobasidium sp. EXF-8845]KAI4858016.1 hypothetical protein E4T45_00476 [Aureobasidium sp. EXF-8846]
MGRNVRVPATKACDYCRLRKIKCIACEESSKECQACLFGKLECSYMMPTKRRGPAPKRRHIIGTAPETITGRSTSEACSNQTAQSSINSSNCISRSFLVHPLVSCASFSTIMQDYLDVLYALIPVVHVPTFVEDLRNERQYHDLTFQMFCLAICACIFGILPYKFEDYIDQDVNIKYKDRRAAIADIHRAIIVVRPLEYYDDLSHEKWAINFLMSVTNAHLGHRNRAKLLFAECSTILTELGMHRVTSYRGLDHVETQLRKKAFWLSFIGWSHSRTRDIDYDSMADRFNFETADAEHLMPLEVDDEYITRTETYPQPADKESLVSGFNALIMISDCLVPIFKDTSAIASFFHTEDAGSRLDLGTCSCGRHVQKAPPSLSIMARLIKATQILDNLPPHLSSWALSRSSTDPHFEIMTANIHVTFVWIQNLLLERLIAVKEADATTDQDLAYHQILLKLRDGIWEHLMSVLNNISEANLKPNGYVLVCCLYYMSSIEIRALTMFFQIVKARTVAASLLGCAPEGGGTRSHRERAYLQNFADLLARLDESYCNDNTLALWKEFHVRF